jgi:hypothetical protein
LAAIKILGNMYEVDESLMGKEVEVRYNPYDLSYMLVYFEGYFRGKAQPYRMKMFAEQRVKERAEAADQALNKVMEAIVAEHAEHARHKVGISYARAMEAKKDE